MQIFPVRKQWLAWFFSEVVTFVAAHALHQKHPFSNNKQLHLRDKSHLLCFKQMLMFA